MQLSNELAHEQRNALIECLRVFAARGRAIRLERERQQKENRADAWGAGRDSHGDGLTPEMEAAVYDRL